MSYSGSRQSRCKLFYLWNNTIVLFYSLVPSYPNMWIHTHTHTPNVRACEVLEQLSPVFPVICEQGEADLSGEGWWGSPISKLQERFLLDCIQVRTLSPLMWTDTVVNSTSIHCSRHWGLAYVVSALQYFLFPSLHVGIWGNFISALATFQVSLFPDEPGGRHRTPLLTTACWGTMVSGLLLI